MKVIFKPNSYDQIETAVNSRCDGIRYGSEFCENNIPSEQSIQQANDLAVHYGKSFSYNIPLLTNIGISKVRNQVGLLNKLGDVDIVTGDLGVLNLLRDTNNPRIKLGRSRVYIPARSPWSQITRNPNPSFFTLRKVEKLFYQTSLNYKRVLDFFKNYGVTGADVDLIPKCFSNYREIIKKGFSLSIHSHTIPIAVTMRCHTARFLNESSPELCSLPCLKKSIIIKQKEVDKKFMLHGNVVYRQVAITPKVFKNLQKIGLNELVVPMYPINEINTVQEIDEFIKHLKSGA